MQAEMSFQDPVKTDHEEKCTHLGDLIGLYCKTKVRGVNLIGAGVTEVVNCTCILGIVFESMAFGISRHSRIIFETRGKK